LLLYIWAARGGEVTSAALTLTHSGVYPLLFAAAWGSSQAVCTAAALAVGRGNARQFSRVVWLGLGLAAIPAFALPWGAYLLCGRPVLAWLVEGSPAGSSVLMVSLQFMEWLTIFFVFDFAINYLSALLRAVNELGYLLKVTAGVAGGFALVNVALSLPPDAAHLIGAIITAHAVWALLLLIRVLTRWPGTAKQDLPAHRTSRSQGERGGGHGLEPADTRAVLDTGGKRRTPRGKVAGNQKAAFESLAGRLVKSINKNESPPQQGSRR